MTNRPLKFAATAPEGIAELEGVVAHAKPRALITLPADWVRELLAYVRALEATTTPAPS